MKDPAMQAQKKWQTLLCKFSFSRTTFLQSISNSVL